MILIISIENVAKEIWIMSSDAQLTYFINSLINCVFEMLFTHSYVYTYLIHK